MSKIDPMLDPSLSPAAKALHYLQTHSGNIHTAITIARQQAISAPMDQDDRPYWKHELNALNLALQQSVDVVENRQKNGTTEGLYQRRPVAGQEIGRSGVEKVDPIDEVQTEVCEILEEECAELAQAASKIKRCGLGFIADDGKELTAKQRFTIEVADVLTLISESHHKGLVDLELLATTLATKPAKLRVWTEHLGHAGQLYGPLQ